MYRMYLFFGLISILNLTPHSVVAQINNEDTTGAAVFMRWIQTSFTFKKPDSSFVALEEGNGYTNAGINATIKYISFPQKYSIVKGQFENQQSKDSTLIIDTFSHNSNGLEAFTVVQEELSPDLARYENFISLATLVNFGDITICVVGAYPKSKDKMLREKFLTSSLTIKEQ